MEVGDEKYLPPDRPARRAGQEPSARLTLDAYVRLRKELEKLETEGRTHHRRAAPARARAGRHQRERRVRAAKHEQALMEGRIRELQHRLKDPEILEAAGGDAAEPGTLVTVRPLDEDDAEDETYLLSHAPEERATGARTVTLVSPFGAALAGSKIGDTVSYQAPGGTFSYRVLAIEPHTPGS
jgi:transcription elongation factor GreA